MYRRTFLVGLSGVSGLAGCVGQSTRPGQDACPDGEVTPIPYPDRPTTLTNESVHRFVADLERAYVYDRESESGTVVSISMDPEPDEVTKVDDGWAVRIETGFSKETCQDGARAVGDGYYTVRYFLNESHIYRAQDGGAGSAPDPREQGTRITTTNDA